jgi:glyoxalase family protein
MLDQIKGLHHVTSMAKDARENNDFFTHKLGLRRVKKTVNFDAPDVYHLYYADEFGTPGSVMTYFPFPNIGKGRHGVGEVGTTVFSVPEGSLGYWEERLAKQDVTGLKREETFGEKRLRFDGPDGDGFAFVEDKTDIRAPWAKGGVPDDDAIRGFHSIALRLKDAGRTEELLKFMGYEEVDKSGETKRLAIKGGNGANIVDIETCPARPSPISAQARCITSPSRSRTGRGSLKCARRWSTPGIRSRLSSTATISGRSTSAHRGACCSKCRPTSRGSTATRIRHISARR